MIQNKRAFFQGFFGLVWYQRKNHLSFYLKKSFTLFRLKIRPVVSNHCDNIKSTEYFYHCFVDD